MPIGVVGEMTKLPLLFLLSAKVMPGTPGGVAVSVPVGAAEIVTVQVSAIPFGAA